MADLTKFLKKNVEGYLFHDLQSLIGPAPLPDQTDSGVGYPLLMTSFAGIELLGALLSVKKFDTNSGSTYFKSYWTIYLYPSLQDGNMIADSLCQLVRHGIAHAYVLKGQIGVGRRQPALHLKRDASGLVYVDAVKLAEDLIKSYETKIFSIVSSKTGNVNGNTMAQRLNEMEQAYKAQAISRPLPAFPSTVAESAAVSTSFVPLVSGAPFKP